MSVLLQSLSSLGRRPWESVRGPFCSTGWLLLTAIAAPSVETDAVPGWSDPRASAAGVPPPPSQLSKEAHAGFAHVASMLAGQGIVDPAGEQHLTSVIVEFFETRMVSTVHSLA